MEHRQSGLAKHALVGTVLRGLGKLVSKNKMATTSTGMTAGMMAGADHSANLAGKSSKMFKQKYRAPSRLPKPVANTGKMKIN